MSPVNTDDEVMPIRDLRITHLYISLMSTVHRIMAASLPQLISHRCFSQHKTKSGMARWHMITCGVIGLAWYHGKTNIYD